MITHLAGTAPNCSIGSWTQRWDCGWNEPTSRLVSRIGFDFGHNALPVLILIAFAFLAIGVARRRKAARAASAPAPARSRVLTRR